MNFKSPGIRSLLTRLSILTSCLILSSCVVFTPKKVVDSDKPEGCELVSSELELEAKTGFYLCGNPDCLAGGILIIPVSLVISGGIVLVNNSYHYIEEALTCDDEEKDFMDKSTEASKTL